MKNNRAKPRQKTPKATKTKAQLQAERKDTIPAHAKSLGYIKQATKASGPFHNYQPVTLLDCVLKICN